jgi:hypothetical protein
MTGHDFISIWQKKWSMVPQDLSFEIIIPLHHSVLCKLLNCMCPVLLFLMARIALKLHQKYQLEFGRGVGADKSTNEQ